MTVLTVAEMDTMLEQQALSWPERARSLKIANAVDYGKAAEELLAVKDLIAKAHERHDGSCEKTYIAWQESLKQRKIDLDPLNQAEAILNSSIGGYLQEQKRKRREEEARLRKEAEELALIEREIEIEEAEAQGATVAEVKTIAERPIVTAPVIQPAAPKVAGITARELWAAEVTDLAALVRYAAANPQYASLLVPNMMAINGLARSLKSAMQIPGVRVYSSANVAARRARGGGRA